MDDFDSESNFDGEDILLSQVEETKDDKKVNQNNRDSGWTPLVDNLMGGKTHVDNLI